VQSKRGVGEGVMEEVGLGEGGGVGEVKPGGGVGVRDGVGEVKEIGVGVRVGTKAPRMQYRIPHSLTSRSWAESL